MQSPLEIDRKATQASLAQQYGYQTKQNIGEYT